MRLPLRSGNSPRDTVDWQRRAENPLETFISIITALSALFSRTVSLAEAQFCARLGNEDTVTNSEHTLASTRWLGQNAAGRVCLPNTSSYFPFSLLQGAWVTCGEQKRAWTQPSLRFPQLCSFLQELPKTCRWVNGHGLH